MLPLFVVAVVDRPPPTVAASPLLSHRRAPPSSPADPAIWGKERVASHCRPFSSSSYCGKGRIEWIPTPLVRKGGAEGGGRSERREGHARRTRRPFPHRVSTRSRRRRVRSGPPPSPAARPGRPCKVLHSSSSSSSLSTSLVSSWKCIERPSIDHSAGIWNEAEG